MAQRPLIWALGTAATAILISLSYSERLARATAEPDARATAVTSSPTVRPGTASGAGRVTVSADYRGHYMVHPSIDNFRIRMLVDTGASIVALTAQDAVSLGLSPRPAEFKMSLSTSNGVVRAARVNLREIRLGDIVVRNVEAVVMPAGALSVSLLGTSFLRRLKGYEVQGGRMVLRG